MAYNHGVQGIVLSNHGGRQLDTSRSGVENLIEVVEALKARGPWPNPKFEVFVDGGIRRASDVLKAIALGAKAVGVGRAFSRDSRRPVGPGHPWCHWLLALLVSVFSAISAQPCSPTTTYPPSARLRGLARIQAGQHASSITLLRYLDDTSHAHADLRNPPSLRSTYRVSLTLLLLLSSSRPLGLGA